MISSVRWESLSFCHIFFLDSFIRPKLQFFLVNRYLNEGSCNDSLKIEMWQWVAAWNPYLHEVNVNWNRATVRFLIFESAMEHIWRIKWTIAQLLGFGDAFHQCRHGNRLFVKSIILRSREVNHGIIYLNILEIILSKCSLPFRH